MPDLPQRIFDISHLKGQFLLRSGARSSEYFDKYLFESDPAILQDIAKSLRQMIPPQTELLAGLEMGGIPVVTLLSHYSQIPCLFVRKKAKAYGTCKLAEGPRFEGKRITIVEDIVSTGGQIVLSAQDLRAAGAVVDDALCIIDRESGGEAQLRQQDIKLHSLFRYHDLVPDLS